MSEKETEYLFACRVQATDEHPSQITIQQPEGFLFIGTERATMRDARRLVDSYNALAGRDPAALDGLLEAVKGIRCVANCQCLFVRPCPFCELTAALAAFQGGGEE